MRTIKFRAWDEKLKEMSNGEPLGSDLFWDTNRVFMQLTGLKDKNGKEIYEGDIVEFVDKWEWYRGSYAIKIMFAVGEDKQKLKQQYEAEPMHRFVVEFNPTEGYNLSAYDLSQDRYEVIGNKFENPELLVPKPSK